MLHSFESYVNQRQYRNPVGCLSALEVRDYATVGSGAAVLRCSHMRRPCTSSASLNCGSALRRREQRVRPGLSRRIAGALHQRAADRSPGARHRTGGGRRDPTRPLRMRAPAIPWTVIRSLRHLTRSTASAQPIPVRQIGRIGTRRPMRKPQFTSRVADRTSLFMSAAAAPRSTPSSPPSPTSSDKARPSPSQASGRSPRGAGPSARAAICERGSASRSPRRGRPPSRPRRPCATRCGDATRSTCAAHSPEAAVRPLPVRLPGTAKHRPSRYRQHRWQRNSGRDEGAHPSHWAMVRAVRFVAGRRRGVVNSVERPNIYAKHARTDFPCLWRRHSLIKGDANWLRRHP